MKASKYSNKYSAEAISIVIGYEPTHNSQRLATYKDIENCL